MLVISLLAIVMCVLRVLEFQALNVRWDSNAYGSVAWATVVTHTTLLLLEAVETLVFTAVLFSPSMEQRDLSAASDNAIYWYFMTGVWIPLAAIVYLSPYVT
jgi:heme/copper-type cytochrome/quinol oxidase subunit 3